MSPTAVIPVCFVLLAFVDLSFSSHASPRIASFNVQVFGVKKVSDVDVLDVLVKVIQRYDIVLIQEIRDSSDTALDLLVDAVNAASSTSVYQHVTSPRLGRTSSKEQYSYVYRTESAAVIDSYQYNDPDDVFQREPFCVKFRLANAALSEIVLIGVHTDPDSAVAEMNALVTVHQVVQQHWNTDNILIMGDLNADCSYASKKALSSLDLRSDPPFTWLIADEIDTTTSNSDCAYDRFVVSGDRLKQAVVPNSAHVFRFDTEYGLSTSLTQQVSDHYPIELELKSSSSSRHTEM